MHIRQPMTVEKTPEKVPKLVHNVLQFREEIKQFFVFSKRSSLGKIEVEGFNERIGYVISSGLAIFKR